MKLKLGVEEGERWVEYKYNKVLLFVLLFIYKYTKVLLLG